MLPSPSPFDSGLAGFRVLALEGSVASKRLEGIRQLRHVAIVGAVQGLTIPAPDPLRRHRSVDHVPPPGDQIFGLRFRNPDRREWPCAPAKIRRGRRPGTPPALTEVLVFPL